ncbi:MAG: hypothetical protein ACFFB5_23220 [Promethearchaeota archaeon]
MINQEYLQDLLEEQKLSENQITNLKNLINKIQTQLEELEGHESE